MIDATTMVRGYAPGQTISVKIYVNNQSKERVDCLEVQLIKVSCQIQIAHRCILQGEIFFIQYDFVL